MQRCWQQTTLHDRSASAWLDPIKLAVEVDLIGYPKASVEVDQIRAAAEQNVLTVIDGCTGVVRRIERIGGRASTEKRACFE